MKKEIKNNNELLDKDIQEILRKNHEEAYNKYKKSLEKQVRNQKILQVIMIIVILITLVLICIWNYKLQKDFTKSCMDLGYDKNYCIEKS